MAYLPLNSVRNITNASTKLGGLAFDGVTASAKDYHTIAAVGTSDISVKWSGVLPSSNPTVTGALFSMAANSGTTTVANSFYAAINTTGQLDVFFWGATTPTDFIRVLYSGIISTYGGKAVDIVFVRNATTPSMTVYVNGVALSGGTETNGGVNPTWAMSINSTYFTLSQQASGTPLNVTVFGAQIFNRALTASEVVTLANAGVAESDKWGSLTAKYTSDFTGASLNGWANGAGLTLTSTTVGASADSLKLDCDTSTGLHYANNTTMAQMTQGKRYRITFDYYMPDTSTTTIKGFRVNIGGITTIQNITAPAVATWTATSAEVTATTTGRLFFYGLAAGQATSFTGVVGEYVGLKNIVVTQIGSILDADLSAGVGYQVLDRSSNNYHGLISTSGTSWTLPRKTGQAIFTASSTGYLGDATNRTVIPDGARIDNIQAYSASGSTFSIGDDSTVPTNVIGSTAISAATLTDLGTPAIRFLTTGTNGRLYVTFSAANSTVFTINYSMSQTT